jgi:6-phosphofructokinase 1
MLHGNIVYGQSGGPSPVINASAYGVLKEALESREITKVFAAKHGIQGILDEAFIDASTIADLELLKHTPASAFGSVRFKLLSHEEDPETYRKIHEVFKKYNIRYVMYNGGNDSMDTTVKLSNYFATTDYEVRVIGVPKTVDNDLPLTDHTPGFGSAAKYIINTMMQLKCDCTVYPTGKVTIVEIMGRHAGWLTASAHVASNEGFGPDLIYIPEVPFDLDQFVEHVHEVYQKTNNCLIAVSEGIVDKDHNFIGAMSATIDAFGHKQLGGVAMFLGDLIEEKLGLSYRAIELSSPQRSASFIRSTTDVEEAIMVGRKAVQFAIAGETCKMVGIKRISDKPYKVEYEPVDVTQVANQEQTIPTSMLSEDGLSVTQEFYDYIYPLIEGEYEPIYKNGVQQFIKI